MSPLTTFVCLWSSLWLGQAELTRYSELLTNAESFEASVSLLQENVAMGKLRERHAERVDDKELMGQRTKAGRQPQQHLNVDSVPPVQTPSLLDVASRLNGALPWSLKAGVVVTLVGLTALLLSFYPSRAKKDSEEKLAESATVEADADVSASPTPAMRVVLFFVIGQSISASTLTVVNKWAMNSFHAPGVPAHDHHHGYIWTLSLIQFVVSALVAKLVGVSGIAKCDPLTWNQAIAYFPAAGMFMITIVAGNAVMNYSNVASFLVLRSLVPVPCALLEMVIYKDPMPPLVSWAALGVIVSGSVIYGASMGDFEMTAVAWAVIFLTCMPVDGLLIKHAISASGLSPWGLVYYNNTLAALPLVFFCAVFELPTHQAFTDMAYALFSAEARLAVAASCVIGISMSYFQMSTRYYISATAFMVLGVVNKFLTVLWNEIFIDRSTLMTLFGVLLTLSGAVAWQFAMGNSSVKVRPKSENSASGITIAFIATLIGLAAAAFVQYHFTVPVTKVAGH
jgi:hypothetical protein